MTSYITARTTRTVIAAVCFGAVADPCLAAPAVTASLASPASLDGTNWG
jgi:hypothetical protein